MNERTPQDPPGRAVPDPHAGEPVPPPQEGLRPEADPSVVRPEQQEPDGPAAGLFKTAGAEAAAHYTHDPGAEATVLAANVGVEEEGIESGQIFGLMLATVLGIIALGLVLYFLFYSPALEETRVQASDVPADRYVELRDATAAGQELIGAYTRNQDGTYRLPLEAAMRAVAQDYAAAPGTPAAEAQGAAPTAAEARYNGLTWLTLRPAPAVRRADGAAPTAAVAPDTARAAAPAPAPAAPEAGPEAAPEAPAPAEAP